MHDIVNTIADRESVLEIREKFGLGVVTAFIRIEGRPIGVIANNPHHLSGAIDSDTPRRALQIEETPDHDPGRYFEGEIRFQRMNARRKLLSSE